MALPPYTSKPRFKPVSLVSGVTAELAINMADLYYSLVISNQIKFFRKTVTKTSSRTDLVCHLNGVKYVETSATMTS